MRIPTLVLLTCLSSLLAGAAIAGDVTAGALKIGQPWSRATPNGAKVAGAISASRIPARSRTP
ncbi:hypothetical protein ACFQFG_20330 [Methylobacterium persicinum]